MASSPIDVMQTILPEDLFLGILCLERKRAERASRRFVLLLLDVADSEAGQRNQILDACVTAINTARRETDPAGWYRQNLVLGVIFTELPAGQEAAAKDTLVDRVRQSLALNLSAAELRKVRVSAHTFSDELNDGDSDNHGNPALYPDLLHLHEKQKLPFLLKRAIDIMGSLVALTLLSPLLILVAVLIKLTSKGPVLFTQERLGQFGRKFKFLKFRSMHATNDPHIHREFMKKVIRGDYEGKLNGTSGRVYKMTDDPRITPVGRILRRTSLDELPQFVNVLLGDMSLVGPRPPLAYEYKEYDVWHRRRVLEIKPGITGLWQVTGRSRVRFDEMVRLDLQYARNWSLWLDMQILFKTPRAVVLGEGAY
jgi:exopolysaccharide biosynthesis polyprenyl glycosylphosphotransferase